MEPVIHKPAPHGGCQVIKQGHAEHLSLADVPASDVVELAKALLQTVEGADSAPLKEKWSSVIAETSTETEGVFAVAAAGEDLLNHEKTVERLQHLAIPEGSKASKTHEFGYRDLKREMDSLFTGAQPAALLYVFGDTYGFNGSDCFVGGYRAVLGFHDSGKTQLAYLSQHLKGKLVVEGSHTDQDVVAYSRILLKKNFLDGIVSAYSAKQFP